jgi:hypothetical protein
MAPGLQLLSQAARSYCPCRPLGKRPGRHSMLQHSNLLWCLNRHHNLNQVEVEKARLQHQLVSIYVPWLGSRLEY